MAEKYLESTKVKVFPSAYRGTDPVSGKLYNPESRLNTEANFTNLINRLVTKNIGSFVVSYKANVLVCSIHGYLFELTIPSNAKIDTFAGDDVYGIIKLLNRNTASDPTNTGYNATSLTGSGNEEILDYNDEFLGLKLTDAETVLEPEEYSLWLLHWNGTAYELPSASKIKFKSTDVEDTTANKNISEEFHTINLYVNGGDIKTNKTTFNILPDIATTINIGGAATELNIGKSGSAGTTTIKHTTDSTNKDTGALVVEGGVGIEKKLWVGGTINDATIETNAITLGSTKALTIQHASLTVGDSLGTGLVKIKSNNSTERALTLSGSPTISGNGVLTLNKNLTINNTHDFTLEASGAARTLKISGANKELAGTGTKLVLEGAHETTLKTGANVTLTLPTSSQTLATIAGEEALVNKTINGISLTAGATGFGISGGVSSKTIAIGDNISIGAAVSITDTLSVEAPTLIDDTTNIYKPLTVGASATYTGGVTIRSAGSSVTTVTGPNGGDAKLVAGTYTDSATTSNSSSNDINKLVKRDALGNFSAGIITANLTGNSSTTTKLATARLFTITDNDGTNSQSAVSSFDGSANYTLKLPATIKATLTGNASSATNVTTNADTSNTLSLVGVTSAATTTLKRDTSITMQGGNLYATTFYASSDRRLKENIVDYKYHDSILDIAVKEFDYKNTNVHTIGFVAQELQEKFPEIVTSGEDGYLSIAENKLVYLLLEEVKQLKEEVEQLKQGG